MQFRRHHPQRIAAAKAAFSERTARRIEAACHLPPQEAAEPRPRSTPDPFDGLWDAEIRPMLEAFPSSVGVCYDWEAAFHILVGPMDRLDAMQVMLTAVECGSLSRASRKLGQPLATVSRKVSELESHLKADLLIRSTKGLELTPAGRTFITAAKTVLEQLNEAERAAAGEYTEPKGDLVVTAPTMFGRLHVLPVVTTFLKTFSQVSVELMLTDRVTHFLDDQVDVALRIGDLPDSSLIATRLGAVRRVTCASPAYLAPRTAPAVPQDLVDHDVISFESVSSPTTWRYFSDGHEVAVSLRSRLSVSTIDAAINAGLAGAGVIRANSYQVADYVRDDLLLLLLETYEPTPRPVHLIYDKRNRLPLKLRAFVDFVVPRLRDRLRVAAI
jgi:DNA-binding transcriptional LysR family regulator